MVFFLCQCLETPYLCTYDVINWVLTDLINAPDLPTVVSGFTYHCLRIYLSSSQHLPTIVSGFTYHCHRIYLLSFGIYLPLSPVLPTVVSRSTYCRFCIYLPSSLDLPTIFSKFTYRCLSFTYHFFTNPMTYMVITFHFYSKENSYGDHFLILPW